jgi:hypothetical protein
MTIKELLEILEHEVKMGRGDFKVMTWDTTREEASDTLRDSEKQEFYICTEN